jgi:hypothetical protein
MTVVEATPGPLCDSVDALELDGLGVGVCSDVFVVAVVGRERKKTEPLVRCDNGEADFSRVPPLIFPRVEAAARMLRVVLYQHHTATSDELVGELKLPLHCLQEGGAALPARFTLRDERGRPRALLDLKVALAF